MLLFSLGVILKRCSRLSPSKAPSREPRGIYFIQAMQNVVLCSHTELHIQTAVFMKEASLSFISRLALAVCIRIRRDDYFLTNFGNESGKLVCPLEPQ